MRPPMPARCYRVSQTSNYLCGSIQDQISFVCGDMAFGNKYDIIIIILAISYNHHKNKNLLSDQKRLDLGPTNLFHVNNTAD